MPKSLTQIEWETVYALCTAISSNGLSKNKDRTLLHSNRFEHSYLKNVAVLSPWDWGGGRGGGGGGGTLNFTTLGLFTSACKNGVILGSIENRFDFDSINIKSHG